MVRAHSAMRSAHGGERDAQSVFVWILATIPFAGVLVPRANHEAQRRPCRGCRRGGDLPADPQPAQGRRRVRAQERGDVHTRGGQAHARAGAADRQRGRRRCHGGLRYRGAWQRAAAGHHGARLHLGLFGDAGVGGGREQGHPAADQRGGHRARGPHQKRLRLVPWPDWAPLAGPRQGACRRQRLAQAAGCLPARGLVRGPEDQGQARAQGHHRQVRPPARARAAPSRRAREHPQVRRQPVRQGASARRRRPALLRHLWRPAEDPRAPARARLEACRLCPLNHRMLPQGDRRLLQPKLLQAGNAKPPPP
eukprot:6201265-Pleurochrysis_carterae.AAC.3